MSDPSSLVLPGLRHPVRIRVDRHGLTHITAADEADLFFAQGFNVAQTRLWQMDLWRRRGLGLLAEAFGYGFVAQDRATRTFLYQGDMDAEWAAYPAGTRATCERFCAGINAAIDRIDNGAAALPEEFALLGTRPQCWAPADIVRIRSNTLTANGISELRRAALLQQGRAAADALRVALRPRPTMPPAAACAIDDAAGLIALLELATAPVVITPARLAATPNQIEAWADPATFLAAAPASDTRPIEGSNNWALAGGKTASGRPLLANDPHRALQTPALRYAVHLTCPAFSIIGAGEPALPGLSIGHNGTVAFGLTIFPADQEDVFRFDRRRGGPQPAIEAQESAIPVRGGAPLPFQTNRYGASPILRLDPDGQSGIALRTVWSEPGAAPYLAGLALATVPSVAAFRARLATWRLPAVNYVAADVEGSIGWFVAGTIPARRPGTGVVPEWSDGDPWGGFIPNEALPTVIDPARGYVMSANECNVPADWDGPPLSHEWYEDFRARRIHAVLGATTEATVAGSATLQQDVASMAARDLVARLRAAFDGARAALSVRAQALLAWDGTIDNTTAETRFFHLWLSLLKPAVVAGVDPSGPALEASAEAVIATLDALPAADRRALFETTLAAAARRAGDPAWDAIPPRRALFRHAIQDGIGRSFHTGPVAWPGDDTTVHFGKSLSDPLTIEIGASFRVVMDLADWDRSVWQNIPSQTPGDGAMVPLLYSEKRIAAAAVSETTLVLGEAAAPVGR